MFSIINAYIAFDAFVHEAIHGLSGVNQSARRFRHGGKHPGQIYTYPSLPRECYE